MATTAVTQLGFAAREQLPTIAVAPVVADEDAGHAPAEDAAAVVVAAATAERDAASGGDAGTDADLVAEYMRRGFKYGNKFQCDKSKLRHVVTAEEHARGSLSKPVVSALVETFRNCGVVALEGAVAASDAADFRANLEQV